AYEFNRLKNPQTGKIPEDIRIKELTYVLTNPTFKKSIAKGQTIQAATWNRRGPFNVGGRTRALAIDRTDENIILAGGVSGGMWRSTNGGASWTQTTGASQNKSVTDVYQDPNNTNTWYYVSGEIVGNSASGGGAPYRGTGVFKSTDRGITWVSLNGIDPTSFSSGLQYSLRVRVDPTNSDVYVAAFDGIYRSTNGGTSFTNVLSGPDARYTDLEISATGVIYATLGSASTGSEGVFKSTNGTSWTNITPSFAAGYQRINIDVAPSNENIIYVFANTPGAGKNNHQVFYSNTAGSSWTNRTNGLPAYGGSVGNLSQGSYNQYIKIKPDNPNVVFIGSTNLYRTTNGFSSTAGNEWIGGYSPANNVSTYTNHHPDNHSLVFYPSNPARMLTGHDGGISRTENNLANNAGTFPVAWTLLSNGYYTTQAYGIAIDPETANDARLMAGFQDNGKWTATSFSATSNWGEEPAGGDGCYVAIVAGQDIRYTSTQNGNILRFEGPNIGSPTDADGIQPSNATGQLFVNPFILDKANQNIMYYPAGDRIWRNTNLAAINSGYTFGGTTTGWSNLTGSDAGGSQITALDVSKANAAHVLYYGTSDGKLFRLNNSNTSTATAANITNAAFPSGANVSGIAVDPSNSNNVIVVFSNYQVKSVFYSTNAGSTWTDISGNLEQNADGSGNGPSVQWAEIHRDSNGGVVYLVGTSTGLYSTEALSGTSTVWTQEGATTIGNVPVVMIQGRSSDDLVAIGTHGNGMFSATVTSSTTPPPPPPVTCISTFPYGESFETDLGQWTQATNDDTDFTRQSGGTGSSNTGPSAANDGSFYVYVEASNPNFPSKTATLVSPCFDLSSLANPTFKFDYHMYGSQVNNLVAEVSTNGTTWTQIFTKSGDQGNSWFSESIDVSAYAGTTVSFRFTVTTGADGSNGWQSDIAIDNISVEGGAAPVCNVPAGLSASNVAQTTATLNWNTATGANTYNARYRVQGTSTWTNVNNESGTSTNVTGLTAATTYEFQVRSNCSSGNSAYAASATFTTDNPSTSNCNAVFPYAESFESGFGTWTQATNDDLNFTRLSGATGSSGTGPSAANDGSTYIYVEASGNNTGYPNKVATITSECFDISALSSPELVFDYHMYGTNINNLVAEVSTNGGSSWTQIFTRSGDQGNSWFTETVSLSAYAGSDVSVRFTATTGSGSQGWRSDIALDNIRIQSGSGGGGAPTGYCASTSTNVNDEWIQRVQIGSIDNNSGSNGGYGDFTAQQTDMVLGSSVNTTLTIGWAGSQFNESFSIWIDFNRDGDFADAGELVATSGAGTTNPVTGSFTVPSSAQTGLTRMRISMQYSGTAGTTFSDPCATFTYGEVEDYTVNLVPGTTAPGLSTNPTTAVFNTTYSPDGVKDIIASAYPNPAVNFTTVKAQAGIGTQVKMVMMDVNGIGLISKQRTSETGIVEERFDTSKLRNGLYLIKVFANGGSKIVKVMVTK
ncbi:MAG TPA: hypothetical protein DCS93_33970, partial [Microscillaceae bacterium]|nr:hypothetical protein [Microscillaceae bacterium]